MHLDNQALLKKNQSFSKKDSIIFFLFSSYLLLIPFYFWESGLPQLSDMVLLFLIIAFLIINKMKIKIKVANIPIVSMSFYFTVYVVVVNLVWMFILSGPTSLGRASLYYIFNHLTLTLFISLHTIYGLKIFTVVYKSVTISVYIQFFLFILNGGYDGTRMIGSFNNPNQLGYYALLTAAILIFLVQKINVNPLWFILSLISTTLLIIASLSTSAILSYIVLIVFFIFTKIENKKIKQSFVLIFIIITISILYTKTQTVFFENSKMVEGLRVRLNTVERKTGNMIDERGYSRLIEYPQYWIFGAGEGAFRERFGSGIEFHSLFGNIQVSYGLIGLILFIKILYQAIKEDVINKLYILIPIFIYGLTHNGIRSGLFWILLGILAIN